MPVKATLSAFRLSTVTFLDRPSRMLKKSASFVLASLRDSELLEGIFRSPRSMLRANGHTKCGWYLLALFARCGRTWDKARLGAPGLGG
jgi:hypothetical protein